MTAAAFGRLLDERRRAKGHSHQTLATATGLGKNTISTLIQGKRTAPFPDTLKRLADCLYDETEGAAKEQFLLAGSGIGPPAPPPQAHQLEIIHTQIIPMPLSSFTEKSAGCPRFQPGEECRHAFGEGGVLNCCT